MLNIFNQIISYTIPIIPKSLIWRIAHRYVAGTNIDEALLITQKLNNGGFKVTLDILGEHTNKKNEADNITKQYCQIYDEISSKNLDCNISVKPTHIGLDVNPDTYYTNIEKLLSKAIDTNNFLRLDMESSLITTATLSTIKKYNDSIGNIGTVSQAYLYRTKDDIKALNNTHSNIRLCKGIYKEGPDIAIQNKDDINNNYIDLLIQMFKQGSFAAIATHDTKLIDRCYKIINDMNIKSNQFEFQSLYGVPMKGYLEKHLSKGYNVRIYVPFGIDWYKYSIRRLKENPNIVGYIIKNLFSKK